MGRLVFADSRGFIARFMSRGSNQSAANRELRRLLREGRILLTTNDVLGSKCGAPLRP